MYQLRHFVSIADYAVLHMFALVGLYVVFRHVKKWLDDPTSGTDSIPLNNRLCTQFRDGSLLFAPRLLPISITLVAGVVISFWLSDNSDITDGWFVLCSLVYSYFLLRQITQTFKPKRVLIITQSKTLEIGRKNSLQNIPFDAVYSVSVSGGNRNFLGKYQERSPFKIEIFLKNGTSIFLGKVSGIDMDNRANEIKRWINDAILGNP